MTSIDSDTLLDLHYLLIINGHFMTCHLFSDLDPYKDYANWKRFLENKEMVSKQCCTI